MMADDRLPGTLVFDLDGTLLDSMPGIRHSVEAAGESATAHSP